jgi:cysteine desulfurase/selenocysteine lyase
MPSYPDQGPLESILASQFNAVSDHIYLNHAAISPWPLRTTDAVKAFAEENSRQGPEGYKNWVARENQLRRDLASLLNAGAAADIALLKNTTEGICSVAFGLQLQCGDNIVLPAGEFPSNCMPWLAQAERGAEIRQVDVRAVEDAEAALIDAMDEKTRVLAVSAVQWTDGFRLNLQQLGRACRQRNVLFFVDAIQQLGALQLDVRSAQIDFLAADAHKWLLGPEGVAVFFSTAQARQQLKLLQVGWHSLKNHWAFDNDTDLTSSARRFEAGSPNSLGQVALHASLQLLLEAGVAQVEQRVLANTACLMDGLNTIDKLQICSRQDYSRRSGIVSFRHLNKPIREFHDQLQSLGLRCSLRNGAIRLSPHFYQGEDVMQEVLARIEKVCSS